MKLKSAGAFIAASLLMTAGNANANLLYDIYGGLNLGAGGATVFESAKNKTYSARSYGAMFGIDIPLFRIEAEYNLLDIKDINMHTALLNGYFKVPFPVPFLTPYVGAGAGIVFGGDAPNDLSIEKTAAFQAMLGITLEAPLIPIKADIEARAFYAHNIVDVPGYAPDVLQYDARVKLRYVF